MMFGIEKRERKYRSRSNVDEPDQWVVAAVLIIVGFIIYFLIDWLT